MTFIEQEHLEQTNWRGVAVRVNKGEFDQYTVSAKKKLAKRTPPTGSLQEALIIGLRGYSQFPEVELALSHIRNPE